MVKNLSEFNLKNFSTGLNTTDSQLNMADSDLPVCDNVEFTDTGGVKSINGLTVVGNDIYVNGIASTKILGSVVFNGLIYLMASNGTNARLVYKGGKTGAITAFADGGGGTVTVTSNSHTLINGDYVTITGTTHYNGSFVVSSVAANSFKITTTWTSNDATGVWTATISQVVDTNFDKDALVEFQVYSSKLYFVNGVATGSNILNILTTANALSGLTTTSGLEAGVNTIKLHLERLWISKGNKYFVSKMYPTGTDLDWDASTVYSGANTAGIIQIDNNTEDAIVASRIMFQSLVVFRSRSVWLIEGQVVLQMYISKKTNNTTGVYAPRSVALADTNCYFLSAQGIKLFSGQTVKEGTTNVDTLSTDRLDRKIQGYVDNMSSQTAAVGFAFKDRYYLADPGNSSMFVFNEVTGGWSRWTDQKIETFLDLNGVLYGASVKNLYTINTNTSASVHSTVRTKDYNLGSNIYTKIFHSLIAIFRTLASTSTFTLYWYLDGSTGIYGSLSVTVSGNSVLWDTGGLVWDGSPPYQWDTVTINFDKKTKRHLQSGKTISFVLDATGTNRFSMDSLDLIFETTKRGGY